jgi:hypothetical protein
VDERALGDPKTLHIPTVKMMWEYASGAVPEELRSGALLISDNTEWLAGRVLSWGAIKADVVLVYGGDRDVNSVEVGINSALEQPGPAEAVTCITEQIEAIRDMTPAWVPVQNAQFKQRKEAEKERKEARQRETEAKKTRAPKAKPAPAEAAPAEPAAAPAPKKRKRTKEPTPPQPRVAVPDPEPEPKRQRSSSLVDNYLSTFGR